MGQVECYVPKVSTLSIDNFGKKIRKTIVRRRSRNADRKRRKRKSEIRRITQEERESERGERGPKEKLV